MEHMQGKCPVTGMGSKPTADTGRVGNRHWWPNTLSLDILRQHSERSNPLQEGFNYIDAFKSLDYAALKKTNIEELSKNYQLTIQ